jgi:signal transduction histidine kinase
VLLWIHAAAIFGYSLLGGFGWQHGLQEGGAVGLAAVLATIGPGGRRLRSAMASIGLLTSSAVLVHLSGGYIEMHFHFFVMVVVISLYQDWVPFLLAIGYVVLHHGVVGVLDPRAVYNHFDAWANPWKWALIHGVFVLGASVASLVNWRLTESAHERAKQEGIARIQDRAARAAAEAGVRARDDFLSIAAHELKTPITGLLGFSELALLEIGKGGSSPELHHAVEVIQHQSAKLSGLVGQLLDISRIEAGKMLLNPAETDVVRIAREVAAAAQTTTTQHTITVEGPSALKVNADPLRLEQVLTNLVANAVKFSPTGGAVDVNIEAMESGGARIAVVDHGIGIPPADRTGIFDRFYQAHATDFYGGLGLGLYISRQIVELHGGHLTVEFPAGGGTRFVAELPASPVEHVACDEEDAA